MRLTGKQLMQLVASYMEALAGSEIIVALRNHVTSADLNVKFIKFDDPEPIVVRKVFEAAQGQNKLKELIDVILVDGFSILLPDIIDDRVEFERVFSDSPDEFDDASYLEWLRVETEYVDIRGIGETKANQAIVFPILDLYTELFVEIGLTNLDLNLGRLRGQMRIPLTQIVESTRCLMIMGEPGSGKTTFLRFIARRKILESFGELPIYIRLVDVYDYAIRESLALESNIFLQYCENIGKEFKFALTEQGLDKRAEEGRCLWLLDSLDELPSDDAREKMVAIIEKASRRWKKCKFVLTSRPLPIRAKAIPIGFEKVGIDYWNHEDIKMFLIAWTSLLYPDASDEKKRRYWGTLLSTIMERADLRNLARNAVMVTAMAVVNYNEKKITRGSC